MNNRLTAFCAHIHLELLLDFRIFSELCLYFVDKPIKGLNYEEIAFFDIFGINVLFDVFLRIV